MHTSISSLLSRLTLLAALGFPALTTQAQVAAPTWASVQRSTAAAASSGAQAEKVAVAADGSRFVSGAFAGPVNFGGTTLPVGSSQSGIYVAKYDANGTLVWIRYALETDGETRAAVAVDAAGNAILTGYFGGSLSFSNTTIAPLTTAGPGVTDSYVAKFDPQGNLLWARAGGATANGDAYAATAGTDALGNIYVGGDFSGSLSFGGTPVTASNENIFLFKLTPAGTVVWARTAGGADSDYGYALTTDAAGNAYLTGSFSNSATFGTTTLTTGGSNDEDGFVVKYDTQGTVQWAQRFGVATNGDSGSSIAVDAAGNVAVGGYTDYFFNGTEDGNSIFLGRYNSQGVNLWSRKITPTETSYISGYGVAYDGKGGLYLTGNFLGSLTFGSTTLTAVNNDNGDLYVARFNGQGNAVWADKVSSPGQNNGVIGLDVAADALGNAYVAGVVGGNATFGTIATSGVGINAFVAKLNAGGTITASRPAQVALALSVYPNPASEQAMLMLPVGGGRLVLTDALGRTVREQTLPATAGACPVALTGLTPGLYHLQATLGNGQPASARLTVR
ncbi:SBBP repeat-containing protein [Hymenobacter algoricola]|uniref:T9SS type A sorting domain-containing protein n=1 Tax=Hymenobacter algoricola TaxID=486267 RepID=A0ABP7MXQ7_9BACT